MAMRSSGWRNDKGPG